MNYERMLQRYHFVRIYWSMCVSKFITMEWGLTKYCKNNLVQSFCLTQYLVRTSHSYWQQVLTYGEVNPLSNYFDMSVSSDYFYRTILISHAFLCLLMCATDCTLRQYLVAKSNSNDCFVLIIVFVTSSLVKRRVKPTGWSHWWCVANDSHQLTEQTTASTDE